MAIAVRSDHREVRHRPAWIRQRDAEPGAGLAFGMIALLVFGIVVVLIAAQTFDITLPRSFTHVADRSQPTRPVDGATPAPKLPVAAPSADTAALAAPSDASSTEAAPAAPSDASSTGAAPAEPSVAAAQPTASPPHLAVGSRARIANTDGVGVVLYGAPRPSARQPAGLMEGMTVTVQELSGTEWARVQADNRQTGWIHAEFLAPAN